MNGRRGREMGALWAGLGAWRGEGEGWPPTPAPESRALSALLLAEAPNPLKWRFLALGPEGNGV